ncbi:ATP-binding protein [Streptomyces sp. NPDC014894]|uniref:ATP-binding protein n=1 Tax=Streptomyces sp. NPDC014894 TaxID=3364931 RepID=UPI0036FA3A0D
MPEAGIASRTPTLTEVADAMGLLERPHGPDGRFITWAFNCGADPAFREVRPCRKIAAEIALSWGHSQETADAAESIVAELMANTMQHVPMAHEIGSVALVEASNGSLVVMVHDRSRARPYRRLDDNAERGRGIELVQSLCRGLGGRLDALRDKDGRGKCLEAWLGPCLPWLQRGSLPRY